MHIHVHISKKIFIIVSALVVVNLLILDIRAVKTRRLRLVVPTPTPTASVESFAVFPKIVCPESCLVNIQEATASLTLKLASASATPTPQIVKVSSNVQEFFIPIGGGTNSSDDWEDVPGLQVYVDTTKYGKIKKAVFEASVHVPTLNQWVNVRLFNVTDKHPVWFSEVTFPGGSPPTLLVSQSITLDPGEKLYKVQMKTQLKYQAFLDQARIHIITE